MFGLVLVIHIVLCLALVGIVLLQQGKGADMGAAFGSTSSSVFGASGAGNVLVRATTGVAIGFMVTSVLLVRLYASIDPLQAQLDAQGGQPLNSAERLKGSVLGENPIDAPAPPVEAQGTPGSAEAGSPVPPPASGQVAGDPAVQAPAAVNEETGAAAPAASPAAVGEGEKESPAKEPATAESASVAPAAPVANNADTADQNAGSRAAQ